MQAGHPHLDEQSLRLTEAAVARLQQHPARLQAVWDTLDHWDRVAAPDSKPLRDAWRRILQHGLWQQALDPGPAGQQLRQASPLGKALGPAERLAIIRACRRLSSNT